MSGVFVLNHGVKGTTLRRRRTWYRRRLLIRRFSVALLMGLFIAGACWQNAAHYFPLPALHASQILPSSFWTRGNVRKDLALMAARSARPTLAQIPGVYPYSVIPGGVKDPDELRYAAARDYVVRRRYSHFDYKHAQLVRVNEPREFYLSYRSHDTVYWTRKKVRLH